MKTLVPLGDQAALVYFDDEDSALRFAAVVRRANASWVVDVVSAYRSVAVFYDLERTRFAEAAENLRRLESVQVDPTTGPPAQLRRIPCCYELQLDLARVAEWTHLSPDEAIALHCRDEYVVYAIGFCPGFPYLGYLPKPLCGVPRLAAPRLKVQAGSVGLTGRQTGIYTEARPGGWNIIGRTPLVLVDVADGYFPLRAGDRVRFERIGQTEFHRLQGERLVSGEW